MRSNIDGAEGTQKEAKRGRGRTKGCAGVFLESYNSTKHNPRVNLTSPGGASWTPKKGTMEKKEVPRFRAMKREILFSSVRAKRTTRRRERERDDRTAGDRDRGRQGEKQRKREKERERETEGEAVEPGLAPLRSFFSLAQRLTGIFCRPNRGDVKIALMANQREKPCSNRYLSFSRLRVSLRHRHP